MNTPPQKSKPPKRPHRGHQSKVEQVATSDDSPHTSTTPALPLPVFLPLRVLSQPQPNPCKLPHMAPYHTDVHLQLLQQIPHHVLLDHHRRFRAREGEVPFGEARRNLTSRELAVGIFAFLKMAEALRGRSEKGLAHVPLRSGQVMGNGRM